MSHGFSIPRPESIVARKTKRPRITRAFVAGAVRLRHDGKAARMTT